MPRLPKYGRIAPRITATKGPLIVPVLATYFTPSGPRKGCRNAIMNVFFSDGGFKKQGFRQFDDVSRSWNSSTRAAISCCCSGHAADARSCSLVLADAPARFTSPRCFSSVDWWDEDAPGLSRCSGASGCMGPLLTPCFASCSSLLVILMSNAQ